jgi:hypothetical protein
MAEAIAIGARWASPRPVTGQKCVCRLCVLDDRLHIDFDLHLHSLSAESNILRINLHLDQMLR